MAGTQQLPRWVEKHAATLRLIGKWALTRSKEDLPAVQATLKEALSDDSARGHIFEALAILIVAKQLDPKIYVELVPTPHGNRMKHMIIDFLKHAKEAGLPNPTTFSLSEAKRILAAWNKKLEAAEETPATPSEATNGDDWVINLLTPKARNIGCRNCPLEGYIEWLETPKKKKDEPKDTQAAPATDTVVESATPPIDGSSVDTAGMTLTAPVAPAETPSPAIPTEPEPAATPAPTPEPASAAEPTEDLFEIFAQKVMSSELDEATRDALVALAVTNLAVAQQRFEIVKKITQRK